jgi:ubiquitin carboxyl-terminal hydrolase 34
VAAISDANILADFATEPLTETLAIHLIDCLTQFLKGIHFMYTFTRARLTCVLEPVVPTSVAPHLDATLLERLLSLIGSAGSSASTEGSVKLTCGLFEALLETSLHKPELWEALASHLKSDSLLQDLLLRDSRPAVRKQVAKQIVSKCTFSPR